ncbi:hypothetical protein ACGGZK_01830 [Agromyces sp. MMS24-K17]|uniref:hypothetical protein n=1 Tax=Agromyces sp. MMS24-K17 TaxID=3372850 RepID=UPI00375497F3
MQAATSAASTRWGRSAEGVTTFGTTGITLPHRGRAGAALPDGPPRRVVAIARVAFLIGWRGHAGFRRILAGVIGMLSAVAFAGLAVNAHAAGPLVAAVWAVPAAVVGLAMTVALLIASASRESLTSVVEQGLPALGPRVRATTNSLAWTAIGVLAVHFTGEAFAPLPGGTVAATAVIAGGLCVVTHRLHLAAIEHEAYRTFNLVAMVLAMGSLASMAITPTGEWWTRNFSTLGTSDDIAAACFNIAIVMAGAGVAALGPALSRALRDGRFEPRRGGVTTLRVLVALIGISLMGVGLVPIDGATVLHNAFACGAAGAFAVAAIGVPLFVRRAPRRFVAWSYASIATEVTAMVAYDGLDLFNLTVFEITAFSLVFAWLIAMVVMTASPARPRTRRRLGRQVRHVAPHRMPRRHHARPPQALPAPVRPSGPVRWREAVGSRRAGVRVERAPVPAGAPSADDPPDGARRRAPRPAPNSDTRPASRAKEHRR